MEGLAVIFRVKKFHQYLFGRRFTITSDHKPLQHIFKETSTILPLASACIQRWALLLEGYNYTISYKPGYQHANADMLRRLPSGSAPSNPPTPHETIYVLETLDSSPVTSAHIRQWTTNDPALSKIQDSITNANPGDNIAKTYHQCWPELSVE